MNAEANLVGVLIAGKTIARAVGGALRDLRLRAGLTQGQLADLTGTHRPIVGLLERGVYCPTLEVAALHAECCGGSVADVARAIDRVIRQADSALRKTPQPRVSARARH